MRSLSHTAPGLQKKLTVSRPGDRHELEADLVADQVMRMPESPASAGSKISGSAPPVLHRKHNGGDGSRPTAAPSLHQALASPGRPLDPTTRHFMEPRFGYDFARVRIHDDPLAAQSAQDNAARAFTVGNHIVFGAGEYKPSTLAARHLLAHELSHVIQQNKSNSLSIQRQPVDRTPEAPAPKIVTISAYYNDKTAKAILSNGKVTFLSIETELKPGTYKLKLDPSLTGPYHYRLFLVNRKVDDQLGAEVKGVNFKWTSKQHLSPADMIDLVIISTETEDFLKYVQSNYGAKLDPADRVRIIEAIQESGLPREEWFQLKKGERQTRTSKEAVELVERYLANRELRREEAIAAEDEFQRTALLTMAPETGLDESMTAVYKDYVQLEKLSSIRTIEDVKDFRKAYPNVLEGISFGGLGDYTADLTASINRQLQEFNISGIPEFKARIASFETFFRKRTVSLAVDVLHNADVVCDRFLVEAKNVEFSTAWNRSAKEMDAGLAPSRESLETIIDAADEQAGKAIKKEFHEATSFIPDSSVIEAAEAERQQAEDTRESALDQVARLLPQFPFIAWPDFPREKLLRDKDLADVMYRVSIYLLEHRAAIKQSLSQLESDSTRIYKLDILLSLAKDKLFITNGSIFDLIIGDEVEKASHESLGEKLKTALLFALMIGSFFVTGGASVVVAVGITALSASQAYDLYNQYNQDLAAHKANLSSLRPSEFWVIASIIGAGLDAKGALDLFAHSAALRKAIEGFSKTRSLTNLGEDLSKLTKSKELSEDAAKAIRDEAEKQLSQETQHAAADTTSTVPDSVPSPASDHLPAPDTPPVVPDTPPVVPDTPPVVEDPVATPPVADSPATPPPGRRSAAAREGVAVAESSLNNTRNAIKTAEENLSSAQKRLLKAQEAADKAKQDLAATRELGANPAARRSGDQAQLRAWEEEGKGALDTAETELKAAKKNVSTEAKNLGKLQNDLKKGEQLLSEAQQAQPEIEELERKLQAKNREQADFEKQHRFPSETEHNQLKKMKADVKALEDDIAARIERLKPGWYDALRRGTPGDGAVNRAFANMSKVAPGLVKDGVLDVTSQTPKLLSEAEQTADHIYPVQKIMREPGFAKLSPADQAAVLELQENYLILSGSANSSKGSLTFTQWFKTPIGSQVPVGLRSTLIEAEKTAKKAVQDFIAQRI